MTLLNLSLAPLQTKQAQHTQQITLTANTPMIIPIILPMLIEDEELEYLSGCPNSQLKESTSRQKASLISCCEAFLVSMEDRRLLAKVTLGEADSVALSDLLASSTATSLPSNESRVLLTASKTTGDGLVSYVILLQSTSM